MAIRIFDYLDYKMFISSWVSSRPKKGRGEYLKMAKAMSMHTTQVSQVFKSSRELTLEQADALSDYLKLPYLEKRYFLDLVNFQRAGTQKLKSFYKKSLKDIKGESDQLKNRLKVKKTFSETEKAIYYADSIYSEAHLLTTIPKMNSLESISKRLKKDPGYVEEILQFLLETGLVKMGPKGLEVGDNQIHIDAQSPHVLHHHRNWRLKALQKQSLREANDLFYTGPMTLSREDFEKCKEILRLSLENIYKIIEPSPSENLYCLNFDFFEVDP
ncbi:MAG: DUF4423 domain-containing protein [Bdellovibrionales bacterium]|nr:DUF4423 domain-containing protein [Bdellovibrionales bacterium]